MSHTLTSHCENESNRAAIIFIHGYGGNATKTWGQFPEFVCDESVLDGWDVFSFGYSTHLVPDLFRGLWAADPDLEALAKKLKTELEVDPLGRYERFVLVAHSMGGLVSQWALLTAQTRQRCHALLLYGTPSNGLEKAGIVQRLKTQFRDMVADGRFITSLRSSWRATFAHEAPFQIAAVAGERDEFVPKDSSWSPFPESTHYVVPGNHVQMVKPANASDTSVRLLVHVLADGALPQGPLDSARLAVEKGEFAAAIEQFEAAHDGLDESARIQYAIALDRMGRRHDAIDVLRSGDINRADPDALGTLGGRLKRQWRTHRQHEDGREALDLYRTGYKVSRRDANHAQAFYHAINVAYLQLCFEVNEHSARRWSERALAHCARDASRRRDARLWKAATEGEAHLLLRNVDTALDSYQRAIALAPDPWQVASMMDQAVEIARILYSEDVVFRLDKIFQTIGSEDTDADG